MKVFKKITSSMRFLTLLTLLASNCMLVKASEQTPKRTNLTDDSSDCDSDSSKVTINELVQASLFYYQAPLYFEGTHSPQPSEQDNTSNPPETAPQYLNRYGENSSEDDTNDDLSSDDNDDAIDNGDNNDDNSDDELDDRL